MIRVKMKLRTSDMAAVLGVSRMTYHRWVNGDGNVRTEVKRLFINERLRDLLRIVHQGWPPAGYMKRSKDDRLQMLLELLP